MAITMATTKLMIILVSFIILKIHPENSMAITTLIFALPLHEIFQFVLALQLFVFETGELHFLSSSIPARNKSLCQALTRQGDMVSMTLK